FFRLEVLRPPGPMQVEKGSAPLRRFERPRPQTGVRQFPPWLRFRGLYRPRAVGAAVGLLDVLPALESRIRLQCIRFGNPDTWLAGNCVLASCRSEEHTSELQSRGHL